MDYGYDFYLKFFLENWWMFLLAAVEGYLLGSVNTAVLVTRKDRDIRTMGSGNAGFTNVLRSVGKGAAIVTIVCDALKCVAAVFLGQLIFFLFSPGAESEIAANMYYSCGKYIAGIFCIIGHSYPVYFKFKGGKGVVTSAALIACVDWRVFFIVIAVFGIVFLITKIISASSVTAAVAFVAATFCVSFFIDHILSGYPMVYVVFTASASLIIAAFVIIKHKDNIGRLIRGEEKKITAKKQSG